jgi:hypothetical protein
MLSASLKKMTFTLHDRLPLFSAIYGEGVKGPAQLHEKMLPK